MHWNHPGHLPPPGCPIIVKLRGLDREHTAIRPSYISSYSADPGYFLTGKVTGEALFSPSLPVAGWRYP